MTWYFQNKQQHAVKVISLALMLFFMIVAPLQAQTLQEQQISTASKILKQDLVSIGLPEGLDAMAISDVIADYSGKVWIGTLIDGVWMYDPFAPMGTQWTHYDLEAGLGQNTVNALVLDRHGRVWAGHPRLGVSVFNGKAWKNLNTTAGPLGAQVNQLVMNRANGDVWMATEMGLSVYRPKGSYWMHFGRPEGMHDSTLRGLVFDRRMNLYVVTRKGQLIRGEPRQRYLAWTRIQPPIFKEADLKQAVVLRDNRLVVRGKTGTWISDPKGDNWKSLGLSKPVLCMTIDQMGRLWLGLPGEIKVMNRDGTFASIPLGNDQLPSAIHTPITGGVVIGMSKGLTMLLPEEAKQYRSETTEAWPVADSGISARDLKRMQAYVAELKASDKKIKAPAARYLGEDWQTRGFWLGRYGYARALPLWRPNDTALQRQAPALKTLEEDYFVIRNLWSQPGTWELKTQKVDNVDHSALWVHGAKERRRVVAMNTGDHDRDPKHFRFRVQVDQGPWRLSLYLMDAGVKHSADVTIKVYAYEPFEKEALEKEPLLEHRVDRFAEGVYVNLMLMGQADYLVSVEANDEKSVLVQGIFGDRLGGKNPARQQGFIEMMAMRDIDLGEPAANYYDYITAIDESLGEYTRVWRGIREVMDRDGAFELYYPWSRRLHRSARLINFPDHIKYTWRYQTGILDQLDEKFFEERLMKDPEPEEAPNFGEVEE